MEGPSLHPPRWKITIHHLGAERQPLVVIDDFHDDPTGLFESAVSKSFATIAPQYPGVRASAPASYFEDIRDGLGEILQEQFMFQRPAAVQECFFSLTTTRPKHLIPMQRIPHFDGVGDKKVALLHYLCDAKQGGTAFYRHRSTRFETITEKRFSAYKSAIEKDVVKFGMPDVAYFRGSNALFERIYSVDAAYNRAVMYRGANLHAIDIPTGFSFGDTPLTGRLTVNSFLTPAET